MIKAVIFDLDGSLVDSMWIWHVIDLEYLGRFGIPRPENLQTDIGGRSFSETAVYFKERFKLPDTLQQIKDDWNRMAWDKYSNEVPLKEGVMDLMEFCKAKGILMGIATSNSRELVDNIVSVHQLEQYISCIMTGCEVEKGKPAPDVYLAVADRLGVNPEECLVFEDIVEGIMAGKAAGMKVCAVYDRHSEQQDEEKRRLADYYTYTFRELIEEDGIFTDF
jgi:16S rRNA pseudouridine516 synthase